MIKGLYETHLNVSNLEASIHFYGNVLGIFLLAFFFKHIKGNAVFTAALITQVLIIALFLLDNAGIINLPYLWLNLIGCVIVIFIANLIQKK